MKKTTKRLSLLLAALLCAGAMTTALSGCQNLGDGKGDDTTAESSTGTTPDASTPGTPNDGTQTTYTVSIKTVAGMPMEGINVNIYTDSTLQFMKNYASTKADGSASLSLPASSTYVAVLTGVPEGYAVEPYYPLSGATTTIDLTSSLISTPMPEGHTYQLGDVMHDFSVTDSDGKTQKLSEILKVKKMVMLNFWFSECSPCVAEFPYMNTAYQSYHNDVEILALNHYADDTPQIVQNFKESNGLLFPMAKDNTQLGMAFNIAAYPTSIVIDRYGVICLREEGGIPDSAPFISIFEHFTAEEYQQKLVYELEDIVEREKPSVEMPSSDEINAAFSNNNENITYRADEDEYSWPFVTTKKGNETVLVNSNKNRNSSYAILYADVTLKAGQAVAFDYLVSSEQGRDILYMLVDREDLFQISGEETGWKTCYTYVADRDGKHEIAFCYMKDSSTHTGEDSVYIKNLRFVDASKVDQPTYIPRQAANDLAADGFGYESYITPVFNETDGLYHVGTADGPLLLANLLEGTRFSTESVYSHAANNRITVDGVNYFDKIEKYASYAGNAYPGGVCSVNEELKSLLEKVAAAIGIENDEPRQWLQMCTYYDAYGTNGVQMEDPIKGLAPHTAFEAVMGAPNSVTYNRVIMPRGMYYKFVPENSGAYRITSNSENQQVEGWVFDETWANELDYDVQYYVYEGGERLYNDLNNVSMVVYFEAGKDYYIDIAYYDPYAVGTFTFDIQYLGESYQHFTAASPGYFTTPEGTSVGGSLGDLAEILAGGIQVALGPDGLYHEKRADGTLGSIVYADFEGITGIFSHPLKDYVGDDGSVLKGLISNRYFDFTLSDMDTAILQRLAAYGGDAEKVKQAYRNEWQDDYETYATMYELDAVLAGKKHGTGIDRTAEIEAYYDKIIRSTENPELDGCVPVDEKLGELLQELMDKCTFADVKNSWTKVCYYYQHVGA